ncbi:TIM protein, partial [Chroicocephalus maculipennis]|nr:TIM protein [Chroicocephalus maculipennis]
GMAGPLRWLENCLRRAAGDREEDGEWSRGPGAGVGGRLLRADSALLPGVSYPVPLVPLSEENEDAMEDRRFKALLRQLGLRPPASEQVRSPSLSPSPSPGSRHGPAASPLSAQESFWRIPAALTPQQLRRAAASIAHHGPDPPPPQGLLEPPQCPQAPDAGEGGANPCPHCCSEEPVPVPSPVQPGTKRRRALDSEDDDDDGSSGGCHPLPSLPGGCGVSP